MQQYINTAILPPNLLFGLYKVTAANFNLQRNRMHKGIANCTLQQGSCNGWHSLITRKHTEKIFLFSWFYDKVLSER